MLRATRREAGEAPSAALSREMNTTTAPRGALTPGESALNPRTPTSRHDPHSLPPLPLPPPLSIPVARVPEAVAITTHRRRRQCCPCRCHCCRRRHRHSRHDARRTSLGVAVADTAAAADDVVWRASSAAAAARQARHLAPPPKKSVGTALDPPWP